MIEIDNLSASPDTFISGKAKRVTFSWEASVDSATDNPVEIDLTIEDSKNTSVFFLDVNDKEVPSVSWKTSNFKEAKEIFKETLFIRVTQSQSKEKECVITMNAKDNNSDESTSVCSITYK